MNKDEQSNKIMFPVDTNVVILDTYEIGFVVGYAGSTILVEVEETGDIKGLRDHELAYAG